MELAHFWQKNKRVCRKANPFFKLVATAAATAVATAAEKAGQRAVLPHTVYDCTKYGGAATGKYAFETVTAAATCRKQ